MYSLQSTPETLSALQSLETGVVGLAIIRGHPAHPGCWGCVLETSQGAYIKVYASEAMPAHRFEVFPLAAKLLDTCPESAIRHSVFLSAPVLVTPLSTQEWLDPLLLCPGAMGQNPIMQCKGPPGSAPSSASQTCTYVGGIKVRGANDAEIFIATANFPLTIHVQGLAEDPDLDQDDYQVAA